MTGPSPRLYLISPLAYAPAALADQLSRLFAAAPVAAFRLRFGDRSADEARAAVAALRGAVQGADVALILEDAYRLAAETGADGVHLTDGPRRLRAARTVLGDERSVGAYCGASKHLGLVAGEAGADYVAFGPVAADPTTGEAEVAEPALFTWWTEMIEIPCVAEGGLTPATAPGFNADFLALGPEIWREQDPVAAFTRFAEVLDRHAP